MRIYVCIKHVPDTGAAVTVVGETDLDESVNFVVNPFDEYALEQALRVRETQGRGEVVAVTVGKENATKTIRSALAAGADRGILVKIDTLFSDSILTSRALKKAIEQDGAPDLIFTGKQSTDSEGMQTHFRLAAAFDMPTATDVVAFSMAKDRVIVEREIGGGNRQIIEMTLPCVIGATKGLNEPRYLKLPDIIKAKKKEIKQIKIAELGIEPSAGQVKLVNLRPIPDTRGTARMLRGNPQETAETLVHLLKNETDVL